VATKKKTGQRPGSMHIDRRAKSILESHVSEGPDDELLNTNQVAEWLGCSPQSLEIYRSRGEGPRFIVIGPRNIKYRRSDVKAWLKTRVHQSTREYAER
jgi:predicted DNA-binding transcriptional regulator AlpA